MYVDTMCCKWTSLFWCQASGTRRRPPQRGWTTLLGRKNDHLRVEMETGPLLSGDISFWIVASAGGGGGFYLSQIQERRSPEWRIILKYTIDDAFTVIVIARCSSSSSSGCAPPLHLCSCQASQSREISNDPKNWKWSLLQSWQGSATSRLQLCYRCQ